MRGHDGRQVGPQWRVSRLPPLSRVQEHKEFQEARKWRDPRRQRSGSQRTVRTMRPADAVALGKIRQIPRLQRVPGMQEHPPAGKAGGSWCQMPGMQGRKSQGAKITSRQNLLRLRSLSPLQICLVGPSGARALPSMWRADPGGKKGQADRPDSTLFQQGMWLFRANSGILARMIRRRL